MRSSVRSRLAPPNFDQLQWSVVRSFHTGHNFFCWLELFNNSRRPAAKKGIDVLTIWVNTSLNMGDVIVKPERATCFMTPYAFGQLARHFLFAGKSLDESQELSGGAVQLYLLAHSIELALKAFLCAKNISMDVLKRDYRHNLVKLLDQAEILGLLAVVPLKPEHCAEIRRAKTYYDDKVFEYPNLKVMAEIVFQGRSEMPNPTVLRNAAELIVTGLEPVLLELI